MTISLNYSDSQRGATFAAPTVADGDIMIVTMMSDSGAVGGSLLGWTSIHDREHASATLGYQSLYKVASSESGGYTFSVTGCDIGLIHIFRDSVGGGTWSLPDDSTNEADSATGTTAAVANSTDDVMFVAYANDGNRSVTTPPSGMTAGEGFQQDSSRAMFSYYEILSSGSGSDTRTLVWSASEQIINAAIVARYTVAGGGATPKGPLGHPFYGPFRGPIS